MKYISHIFTCLLALLLFAGCQSEEVGIEDDTTPTMKEIPVRFRTNLPTSPQTRGMLNGVKYAPVTSIQMLCFDSYGMYVGRRNATLVNSNSPSPDNGTFEGAVPEVTARIHFVGNYEVVLNTSYIGQDENLLMQSVEASTHYSTAPTMVFWGYHREGNPSDMAAWLNATTQNTVYFITDRAIVELGTVSDDKVDAIQSWVISNGRERGYIAPFNQAQSNTDPFTGYYDASDNSLHNPFTEYSTAARYTASESQMEATTNPLFLYEDVNLRDEGAANTVKVILKVKYKDTSIGNGGIRYQAVLLQDTENQQFTITRNHRYVMNLGKLPFELGYNTFAEAATAKTFSNGQTVSVAEEVSVLTNGKVEMDINNGKTSIIYQDASDAGQVKLVPFTFTDLINGGAPNTLDADGNETTTKVTKDNFSVTIADNTGALSSSSADVYVNDFNSTTGEGHIAVKVGTISDNLQTAKITITDKTYGMSRNINFYTITKFQLEGTPTLEKVDGTSRTLTISGTAYTCDTYKLSFTLPADYPSGLYPIDIKFATSTLNAYQGTTGGNRNDTFGVSVESTSALNSSATATAWNYNAANWGYWYTYSIASKPEGNNGTKIEILFDDVRAFRGTTNRASTVGLFLKILYFGDIQEITY